MKRVPFILYSSCLAINIFYEIMTQMKQKNLIDCNKKKKSEARSIQLVYSLMSVCVSVDSVLLSRRL